MDQKLKIKKLVLSSPNTCKVLFNCIKHSYKVNINRKRYKTKFKKKMQNKE